MSLDEELSGFIGRLYEDVYDGPTWARAMRELMRRTGSQVMFQCSVDLREREFSRSTFLGPETSRLETGAREYAEETFATDPSLIWASEHPAAGMCESAAILPRNDYLDHPFIKWHRDRIGTTHWRVFYTQPVDDLSFALSLHPPREAGPPAKGSRALHRLLFDHVERAIRLAARPPDFSQDADAVFALDRQSRVIAMSPGAERLTKSSDGVACVARHLVASDPQSHHRISVAIANCVDPDRRLNAIGGGVRIRRLSGKSDWLALVSPYPRILDHLAIPTPAAVVRILDSQAPGAEFGAGHAQLFGLTQREMEIADALLHGHSLESLASHLSISRNTVRVHLQSLFRKTGTNRQVDLVRVLTEVSHL